MSILGRIVERKTAQELVLSSCSEDSVDCWRMPGQAGIKLALFLQFHTAENERLEPDAARIRMAARNHYPQSFTVTRELTARGATLGSNAKGNLQIRAARTGEVRSVLLPEVVPMQHDPDADVAEVDAQIELAEPPSLRHIKETLTVASARNSERRCACCSRSFRS